MTQRGSVKPGNVPKSKFDTIDARGSTVSHGVNDQTGMELESYDGKSDMDAT